MAQVIIGGSELFGDGEVWHQRVVLDAVDLYLVADLLCGGEDFGYVGEEFVHLERRLHPLLLAVAHALGVVEVLTRAEADEAVVRLGVFLIEEVNIVGGDHLHAVLLP